MTYSLPWKYLAINHQYTIHVKIDNWYVYLYGIQQEINRIVISWNLAWFQMYWFSESSRINIKYDFDKYHSTQNIQKGFFSANSMKNVFRLWMRCRLKYLNANRFVAVQLIDVGFSFNSYLVFNDSCNDYLMTLISREYVTL